MEGILKVRSNIVAYLGVPAGETVTYYRMQGFTAHTENANPREYSRQYVDEIFEQTDVTGYTPNIDFEFDWYVGHPVHNYLTEIINNEMIGSAAVVTIVTVDMTIDPLEAPNGIERDYSVIANSKGSSLDAMTYSGSFKVKGNPFPGRATVAPDGLSLTWLRDVAA